MAVFGEIIHTMLCIDYMRPGDGTKGIPGVGVRTPFLCY